MVHWLPGRDASQSSQHQVIQILVRIYSRKEKKKLLSFDTPLPQRPLPPEPMYKNIILECLKVQAFLTENPSKTQTHASQHFNVTRARISQLSKIVNNLPEDFIDKMRDCEDRNILKTFSGKRLLKIASIDPEKERQAEIDRLLIKS